MKLSEKYLAEKLPHDGLGFMNTVSMDKLKLYAQICALEAQQTLLVSNPSTFPQEKYTDKLAEIVNALQDIAQRENL